MDALRPREVADAAVRVLSQPFYNELLLERKLEVEWPALVATLRWRLGFTVDAMRMDLQRFEAQKGETLGQYQARFATL